MKIKEESRNYPRAPSEIELTYLLNNKSEEIKCHTKDFSATGLSFPVSEELEIGEIIHLELKIPEIQKTIKTKASVVRNWTSENIKCASVQFFDIDYHDFIFLLDYSLVFNIES